VQLPDVQPAAADFKPTTASDLSPFRGDCNAAGFKYGACPSESGAAGTTPQEVKQSALGALGVVGGAIAGPLLDPLFDVLGGNAAAEDATGMAASVAKREAGILSFPLDRGGIGYKE
jgi:hypothetical protein